MAVSRGSSNGPEWEDVAAMMSAFEAQNNCHIEVTASLEGTNGATDLNFSAKAWERNADRRAVKHLAYANVKCRAERLRTVGAALTYLLYRLDFAIAENAWQAALGIEAKPPRT